MDEVEFRKICREVEEMIHVIQPDLPVVIRTVPTLLSAVQYLKILIKYQAMDCEAIHRELQFLGGVLKKRVDDDGEI